MAVVKGNTESKMYVVKRGSRGKEEIKFDKITLRIKYLTKGLDPSIDATKVAIQTIQNLHDMITTQELDLISAKIAEGMKLVHPDYGVLAGRLLVSNLHKSTPDSFSKCMETIQAALGNINPEILQYIQANAAALDKLIIQSNDYNYDYFAIKTLENSYLHKINDEVCDRPQYLYMRIAIQLYYTKGIEAIKSCYRGMSNMLYTHATPTMFNACTTNPQLVSCMLLGTSDSIEGIMKNATDASLLSKWAAGIGIHMSNIRCQGAKIRGTNGKSSGLLKQLQIYNALARCWDQGGRRLGAIAIYLEPHHGDILSFLEMRLPQGEETERCRDLFNAIWMSDLFIKRALANEDWALFSPDTAPGLCDVFDGMEVCTACGKSRDGRTLSGEPRECSGHTYEMKDVYTELYTRYQNEGRAVRVVKARDIMTAIFKAQRETGMPYVAFKDHVNRKSNQVNSDVVRGSNLCIEIPQTSNSKSYASCTLASISVKAFWDGTKYNFAALHDTARQAIRNLDEVIDINKYPVPECIENAKTLRPIAVGIQGLADLFCMMRIPFLSAEAEALDYAITETIYHAAVEESCERAERLGAYPLFRGSPASDGLLQFDLYARNLKYIGKSNTIPFSGKYDWDALKSRVKEHGLRNSLLVAYMPTVSTAQVMGNNESFEPYNSLIYTKTTLGGKFTISNQHMIRHLMELGLWNDNIRNRIITDNGSIQSITEIPLAVREIYKTTWELPQSELMRRSATRSAFIDQSSSLNLHIQDNSNPVLRRILIDGWALGHKTNSYYIRTKTASKALKNNIASAQETAAAAPTPVAAPVVTPVAVPSEPLLEPEEEPEFCKPGCTNCSG